MSTGAAAAGRGASAAAPRLDRPAAARAALLSAGLAPAVALRATVAGSAGGASTTAGMAFGGVLLALSLLSGWRPGAARPRGVAAHLVAGLAGAAVISAAPVLARLLGSATHPALVPAPGRGAAFLAFLAPGVVIVAGEEVLLRGALWEACTSAVAGARGEWLAICAGGLAFGLIHVPWYGWGAFPVDLAVGLWLGALRLAGGSVLVPATAHLGADAAMWWLL